VFFYQLRQIFFLCALICPLSLFAADIKQADDLYHDGNYQAAYQAYLYSANIGYARAYYQLANLHLNGLGAEKSQLKALMYFSLAAEQNFADSADIVAQLLEHIPENSRSQIEQSIKEILAVYGIKNIQQTYFPQILAEKLKHKIKFNASLSPERFQNDSLKIIKNIEQSNTRVKQTLNQRLIWQEPPPPTNTEYKSDQQLQLARLQMAYNMKRIGPAYSAIVDYEIHPDGSVRNMEYEEFFVSQNSKLIRITQHNFARFKTTPGETEGAKTPFIGRAKLGIANYSKNQLNSEYKRFYRRLKAYARELKTSKKLEDRFAYTVLLMQFEWLQTKPQQWVSQLKVLSEAGHPIAQYEYGLFLYREQKHIQQAIELISESAKAGYARAEYRLGTFLLNSPWVFTDKQKALFWFERAAANGYQFAGLKAAEIKILDTGDLTDLPGATEHLWQVRELAHTNPDYRYLRAMLNFKSKPRQLAKAVKYMRTAIDLANEYNWDVSAWENTLQNWISNYEVTIIDDLAQH